MVCVCSYELIAEVCYIGMRTYFPYLQVIMEWQPWLDKLSSGNLGKANSLGNSQAHSIVHLDYTSFNNLLAFLFINIGCCVFP